MGRGCGVGLPDGVGATVGESMGEGDAVGVGEALGWATFPPSPSHAASASAMTNSERWSRDTASCYGRDAPRP